MNNDTNEVNMELKQMLDECSYELRDLYTTLTLVEIIDGIENDIYHFQIDTLRRDTYIEGHPIIPNTENTIQCYIKDESDQRNDCVISALFLNENIDQSIRFQKETFQSLGHNNHMLHLMMMQIMKLNQNYLEDQDRNNDYYHTRGEIIAGTRKISINSEALSQTKMPELTVDDWNIIYSHVKNMEDNKVKRNR